MSRRILTSCRFGKLFELQMIGSLSVIVCSILTFLLGMRTNNIHAEEVDGAKIYERALRSTVWIIVRKPQGVSSGSGSILDVRKGYVLTNYHVVQDTDDCLVQFPLYDASKNLISERDKYISSMKSQNSAFQAKVLYREKKRDLALLQIQLKGKKSLPPKIIPFKLAVKGSTTGHKVISVGNPGASDALFVYTPGEVRQNYHRRYMTGGEGQRGFEVDAQILETTSPTNAGDSGGPLMNTKGELTGVTQGGIVGKGINNVSLFIDVSEVKGFLKDHNIKLANFSEIVTSEPTKPKTDNTSESDTSVATANPGTKTPGYPKVLIPNPPPVRSNSGTNAGPDPGEKEARRLLDLASVVLSSNKQKGLDRLRDIIKKYPNTQAAKEAKAMLK